MYSFPINIIEEDQSYSVSINHDCAVYAMADRLQNTRFKNITTQDNNTFTTLSPFFLFGELRPSIETRNYRELLKTRIEDSVIQFTSIINNIDTKTITLNFMFVKNLDRDMQKFIDDTIRHCGMTLNARIISMGDIEHLITFDL